MKIFLVPLLPEVEIIKKKARQHTTCQLPKTQINLDAELYIYLKFQVHDSFCFQSY